LVGGDNSSSADAVIAPLSESDTVAFIRANTVVVSPPLVPEIELHLASEITPIWQASERALAIANVDPPFWAFAWPGGQALARHILDHPDLVAGQAVLDFGAGSGLVAIAAALAGASAVLAADVDPVAIAAIGLNATLNRVSIDTSVQDLVDGAGFWPVVLAGDMFYERGPSSRFSAWLARLAGQGALVLIGEPGRTYRPRLDFEARARLVVPTLLELEDRLERVVEVLRVRPLA
jgi:predicted nicotinamide N-methyase